MSDQATAALRTAACIAFRHIEEAKESEREQVLIALIEVLPAEQAVIAEAALYHLREQRRQQLVLKAILEGIA